MGGEKVDEIARFHIIQGSPPRGRGKVEKIRNHFNAPGITPAWAGKSSIFGTCSVTVWDHPRVGGEKLPDSP